jgi:cell division protein FtsW (lipid II flippase)
MGTVMSYSTTATLALDRSLPPLFLAHLGALGIGLIIATVMMWIPIDRWRQAALPLWLISLGLLILVELVGVKVNGAQRWLDVPGLGFRFQPVEICKLTTLLLVAAVIARRDGHEELSGSRSLVAAGLALPPVCLLLLQPDLGNAVLLACLVALLLVVGGTRLARMVAPGLIVESQDFSTPGPPLREKVFNSFNRSSPSDSAEFSAWVWAMDSKSSHTFPRRIPTSCFHWWPKNSDWWAYSQSWQASLGSC